MAKFNPKTLTKSEKVERLLIGIDQVKRTRDLKEFEVKRVRKQSCAYCGRPFKKLLSVCPTCGNCQYCGEHNDDKMANACAACGNGYDDPRLDDDMPTVQFG